MKCKNRSLNPEYLSIRNDFAAYMDIAMAAVSSFHCWW